MAEPTGTTSTGNRRDTPAVVERITAVLDEGRFSSSLRAVALAVLDALAVRVVSRMPNREIQSKAQSILDEVMAELESAVNKFHPYNSAHEGYAVILEELDELWDEIKNNKAAGHEARQRKEALQVATTAVRFILDLRS